ncbi:MAG TPA: sensor domain-containing protein [Amycolatopsis sp.]|nr:sensor domain-containing protein [Amycolatopsis sp.]
MTKRVMAPCELDGSRPCPTTLGSLVFLLLSLPLGIAGFVGVVTLGAVGLATAIVWMGLPVLAVLLVLSRATARLERARVQTLLGAYVVTPYRPMPATGLRARWRTRLLDGATWRDMAYLILLLPIGIAEFTLVVTLWSAGLSLATLPIYARYLPPDTHIFGYSDPQSTVETLPWVALGVLIVAASTVVTRAVATLHARYARLMLGPGPRARRIAEAPVAVSPVA